MNFMWQIEAGTYNGDFVTETPCGQHGARDGIFVCSMDQARLGKRTVELGDNKWRSRNDRYQYRSKPIDTHRKDNPHVHLEKLEPETGEVLENWHFHHETPRTGEAP
jgi:hypothetical protein